MLSVNESKRLKDNEIAPFHILLAIMKQEAGKGKILEKELGEHGLSFAESFNKLIRFWQEENARERLGNFLEDPAIDPEARASALIVIRDIMDLVQKPTSP